MSPRTDTYIEKESSINEQIDRMRHSATRALLERDDVIIVASVSCIYGIGSVETYTAMTFGMKLGERIEQRQLIADLVALQYKRNDARFRARHLPRAAATRSSSSRPTTRTAPGASALFGDEVESIAEFDPLTGAEDGRPRVRQGLRQLALRHAAPDADAGGQGHQGGAAAAASTSSTARARCSRRSGSSSAAPSTSR